MSRFSLSIGSEPAYITPVDGDTSSKKDKGYPAFSAGGDIGIELDLPCESYEPTCEDERNVLQLSLTTQATGLFGRKDAFITNKGADQTAGGDEIVAGDFHNNLLGFRARAYKGLGTPKIQTGVETALAWNLATLRTKETWTSINNDGEGFPHEEYHELYHSGMTYEIASAWRFFEFVQFDVGAQFLINNAFEPAYGTSVIPAFKTSVGLNVGVLLSKAIEKDWYQ